jgi:hypothetical protein
VDAAAQLRTRVKAAELEAEYVEEVMLERWAETRLAARPRGGSHAAIAMNVAVLFKAYGIAEPLAAATHVIAAALAQAKS